jgi:hypothetical protein
MKLRIVKGYAKTSGKAGGVSHHKIKNDRGNDRSAKRRGDCLHDELAGTVGIASVTQICRDRVNDFYFFHDLSPFI